MDGQDKLHAAELRDVEQDALALLRWYAGRGGGLYGPDTLYHMGLLLNHKAPGTPHLSADEVREKYGLNTDAYWKYLGAYWKYLDVARWPGVK